MKIKKSNDPQRSSIIKIKNLLQKLNKGDSEGQVAAALCDLTEGQSTAKVGKLPKPDTKPTSKTKMNLEDIYSELNYFRMRMNASKSKSSEMEEEDR
jgi:hypothetical protein